MKEKKARRIFGECMNASRKQGIFFMSSKGYKCVADLLNTLLTIISSDDDIDCAMNIIIMSQTYYHDFKSSKGPAQKVFLQQAIVKHPLWRSEAFWTKALKSPWNSQPNEDKSEEASAEDQKMREFANLTTLTHNMLLFEVERETVEVLILSYAVSKELSEMHVNALKVSNTILLI